MSDMIESHEGLDVPDERYLAFIDDPSSENHEKWMRCVEMPL